MKKIFKHILLYLYVFLLCIMYNSTNWAIDTFNFYNFDEVLFQLTTPIKSASSSILSSYVFDCLLVSIIISIIFFIIFCVFLRFISNASFTIPVRKHPLKVGSKVLKKVVLVLGIIITVCVIYSCMDRMLILDYIKDQSQESSFIEDHYVDPQEVQITFPEEKQNLIYIYAESMESTFFSSDLGGGGKNNYLSPLQELTSENISFSDTELFGGAIMVNGTSWTSGSMVAQTSGLPLKNSFQDVWKESTMLSGAIALGNILEDNGYHQEIMFGSDQNFGNRGLYFTTHGNYKVYDYYTAVEQKKIDKDYYEWWGFEDSKLFEFAKEEIISLSKEDAPFNFTLLTANTHTVDGYIENDCKGSYEESYENAIYCSSVQIADFIHWIQEQDFYSNTTIIVVGDHISMQRDFYPKDTKRRMYNVFINSPIDTDHYQNRSFTSMDYFPTTLASLGVSIEGDKLGLGTNLFSDQSTLMEEVGEDTFQTEISKYSSYYMNTFNS